MNIWLAEIWRSWRASLRRPGFLLLASGVLALGVGASATAFGLLDQVLLRALPLPQPSQLVALGRVVPGQPTLISAREYRALGKIDGVRSIGLLAFATPRINIVDHDAPQRAVVTYADRALLPTMGLDPVLGRNFSAREDSPGGPHVLLLAHHFWKARYGADPHAVGRTLKVEGTPYTIIGVLPERFDVAGTSGDIMLPAALSPDGRGNGGLYLAVARLADGVAMSTVGAQVDARLQALRMQSGVHGGEHPRFGATGYADTLHAQFGHVLVLFQASALLVLLVALVNLANLMLLRALARHHEMAVRGALGASRLRLRLPVLAEGLLVGLLGAGLGVLLASSDLRALGSIIPPQMTGGELHLGTHTLALAMLVALAGTLASAAAGAWRARAIASFDQLREGGRSGIGRHRGRLGRTLVVAQVTLTVVLLCACGMFLRQFWDGAHARWGFDDRDVLTAELSPVRADYPDAAAVNAISQRLLQRLRQIPGVQDATMATGLPVGDFFGRFFVGAHAPGEEPVSVRFHGIEAGYLPLFGIHPQRGRLFDAGDVRGSEPVAIVDRTLAERLYGGQALGQRIALDDAGASGQPLQARIVGVVADTGPREVRQRGVELYLPVGQMQDALLARFRDVHPMHLALRVRGNPDDYRRALVDAVAAVAPQQPVDRLRTMQSIVADMSSGGALTGMWICGTFAVLALLLACVGLYAVMAVAVAAREHEMGVRSALGAPPARLATLVLHSGLAQIFTGLAVGMLLAAAFPRLFEASFAQLDSHAAFGPWVAGSVCVLLLAFGLLACLLPAVRAGRVPPMRALRGE